jgi:phosphoglucosamine mutase
MRYFGTDGIRGTYGTFPITEVFATQLGRAVAAFFEKTGAKILVIGRDTRFSGESLVHALCQGLSKTIDVLDLGILPTPAVSRAILAFKADLGVVITASHNPSSDNGFKLLGAGGQKLPDAALMFLEEQIENILNNSHFECQLRQHISTSFPKNFGDAYASELRNLLPQKCPLRRLVIDAANGATSDLVEKIFLHLGCEVILVAKNPNGYNINDAVGSEHTEFLSEQVLKHKADLGIAFDGDGDRCVICDAAGRRIPGDQVLGILALDLERRGILAHHQCVATIMSNLGLDYSLKDHGIQVLRSDVGDAQVWNQMLASSANFGGEASGHIIFKDIAPCGDGMLTAIMFLSLLSRAEVSLKELQREITLFPQKICNLEVTQKVPLVELAGFQEGCQQLQEHMACKGRILVRYSGTELKIRLLVEALEESVVEETMVLLKKWVAKHVKLAFM